LATNNCFNIIIIMSVCFMPHSDKSNYTGKLTPYF
jgi:hypothetical protein